jgi:hypothetical protein
LQSEAFYRVAILHPSIEPSFLVSNLETSYQAEIPNIITPVGSCVFIGMEHAHIEGEPGIIQYQP